MTKKAIIFDADDTLWATELLYDKSRDKAKFFIEQEYGLGDEWEKHQRKIDVDNVKKFGFKKERFPTSCVEAYQKIVQLYDLKLNKIHADKVWKLANFVFDTKAPIKNHVRKTLDQLKKENFTLILLTKGDERVQYKRIKESGLADYFKEILVVSDKSPEVFQNIIDTNNLNKESTWSIGNSVNSDLIPAKKAGINNLIWIDSHVWEYEKYKKLKLDSSIIKK